jgi:predicted metal-dependent phosphoesterase TrpH
MSYCKMDMHVHSSFSLEAVPGVRNAIFSPEETPEDIFAAAKARGMDFVTITDHDTIDGCLGFTRRYPERHDFIVGEEISSQLPASRLTVHVNVYGHNLEQHEELQKRSNDAFAIVEYCVAQRLPHAWNHPFYRENLSSIEEPEFMRFLSLVPVIEVRNGGRSQTLNVLAEELAVRRNKPVQGGSDTHTGEVGSVYTAVPCSNLPEFFAGILAQRSRLVGQHSTAGHFLRHNLLANRRRVIAENMLRMRTPLERARLRSIGWMAFALAPWVVGRHFRAQRDMARMALARLSALAPLSTAIVDAA